MNLYLALIKFHFWRFLAYPWELAAIIVRRVLDIVFIIIFWVIFSQTSTTPIDLKSITAYFLLAEGVRYLTMYIEGRALGKFFRKGIKDGTFSNLLIKPVKIVPYSYFHVLGQNSIIFALSILNILVALIFIAPPNPISYLLFLAFTANAMFISLAFNILEGALAFVFTEVTGVTNALNHVARVLSGALVPLYLFPEGFRKIVELTPFPSLIYFPAYSVKMSLQNWGEIWLNLGISTFWAISLNLIMFYFWKQTLKKYEATGI